MALFNLRVSWHQETSCILGLKHSSGFKISLLLSEKFKLGNRKPVDLGEYNKLEISLI